MSQYLAIEIGGTKLQLCLGDRTGLITERRRLNVNRAAGGGGIREQIARTVAELLRDHAPERIGVGFGGPVDGRTGRICCSHQIEGWTDFPLAEWLHEQTGLPTSVDNDANVAALGEARAGAGRGYDPVLYVTLGSGVGGGLVVGGSIYHGSVPGESEVGHLRLDRDGTIVEERCSGWAVDRRLRDLKTTAPESWLAANLPQAPGGEAKLLGAALSRGDQATGALLEEVAEDLAFGLSHAVHLFHPAAIVLGGGLSLVGEPLRAAVAESLQRFTMHAFLPGPALCLAGLGEDAVPVGALILAAGT